MKLTKKSLIAIILAVVALVAVGGATLALAAPAILQGRGPGWPWGMPGWGQGGFGRGGVAGTVQSVDASQLVLTTTDSMTITVTVTSQTAVYLMPGRTAGKVTDIKVGDTVQVKGRPNASGVLEAQTITLGPLELSVGGQVTGVTGVNITVQAGQGTQTIVTDANTKFTVAGGKAGTLADVKTGEYVMALVQKQTDGSLLATQVTVGALGGFGRGFGMGGMMGQPRANENRVGGQVTAVDGAKIMVQSGPITQTIVTDTSTKFLLAGGQAGTLADVKTGLYVMSQVQKQSDGSLLATQVTVGAQGGIGFGRGMMGQPGSNENRVGGQVTAVDGAKLTVQSGPITQTIVTDTNTKFLLAGSQAGTLADVKVGVNVMALVQKQTDGSLLATQVTVGAQGGIGFGRGMMGQPGSNENRVGGQVTAVDGAKITVQVGQSTQTIVTDANTKFVVAGGPAGTLADVKKGEYVMALVQKQSDGSLLATQVMVGTGPGRMFNPQQRLRPGTQPSPVAPATQS